MSRGTISEQSSVREGTGCDEVYQSNREPKEGHSWSLGRETLAYSPNEDGESYIGEEDEEEIDEGEGGEGKVGSDEVIEGDGDEGDEDNRTAEVGSLGNLGSGHTRSFILEKQQSLVYTMPRSQRG